ncbi:MAG TPA: acetylxylan esterase [Pirellulales bacterium]|jgi:dienelactone hydrolase|nr:acetylxylan esterase [Pirellulales bacterium]
MRLRATSQILFRSLWIVLFAGLMFAVARTGHAETPRVLEPGHLPDDARLGEMRHVNSYFPFTPPTSKAQWQRRADWVRRQVLVAEGLWPLPAKTPLNAIRHDPVDRPGYTVERVYLESVPGHFVTGSLYRPQGKTGKLPGVLFAHGHWDDGRFHEEGTKAVQQQIVTGAERFENGARYPLQAPCAQLARMGCVVFAWDMEGYADSQQLAHRPGVRAEMNTPTNWGFFSPQAELHLQTFMGLQTLNAVRVLDWFSALPEVDPNRIGMTGASGGGTQTFILSALDPRIAVAFPAVMVGTAMQGGCTCENAAYLRVGTGNVEIAGLIAPRPLGMTGADDWTKELATKGLPQLQQLYALLGVPDRVMAKVLVQFPHNYNYVSREVMYQFMNKHLKLGLPDPVIEEDFKPLSRAEMTVWDDAHPKPAGGPAHERALLRELTADARQQIAAIEPHDAESLKKYREVVGGAWSAMIGKWQPAADSTEMPSSEKVGQYLVTKTHCRQKADGIDLPLLVLKSPTAGLGKGAVIWLDGNGKSGMFEPNSNRPIAAVQKLLDAGRIVYGPDLLDQGEFLADGKPLSAARLVDRSLSYGSNAPCYTFGYNPPLFSSRVGDVLSLISLVRNQDSRNVIRPVTLVGVNGAGPIALAAAAEAGTLIDRVAADTAGFRFETLTDVSALNFLPGAVKYGDLPALLVLTAPHPLWLAGEGAALPPVAAAAYQAAGAASSVELYRGEPGKMLEAAADWLVH